MEALTLTPTPGIARPAVIPAAAPTAARRAVATLFLVNGTLFATWVSRLPAIEAARGFSHAQLGLALFGIALGAMVAMPLAGALSARIGSDRVSRAAVLLYAGMLPVLVLAPTGVALALALFAFGAGHGALDVSMNAQAVLVEKAYRRPIMSSFHALFSTGGLVGAAAGGFIAAAGLSPALHFALAAAVLGLAAMATFPYLLPASERAQEVARAEVKAEKRALLSWPSRGLLALGAIALCLMIGEGAMADWSAIYLRRVIGTPEGLAAAGYAAFSIAMAGGRFFGDGLAARFGAVALVRGSAIFALLGLALVLATPFVPLAMIGFAVVGLGFAAIVPQVFSAAGHRAGTDPGVALATVTTLGYLGFLFGPPAIGFAAGLIGLRLALGILVLTTFLALMLAGSVRTAEKA